MNETGRNDKNDKPFSVTKTLDKVAIGYLLMHGLGYLFERMWGLVVILTGILTVFWFMFFAFFLDIFWPSLYSSIVDDHEGNSILIYLGVCVFLGFLSALVFMAAKMPGAFNSPNATTETTDTQISKSTERKTKAKK